MAAASATANRRSGARRAARPSGVARFGIAASRNDVTVNEQQMHAIEHLYDTTAVIHSARAVLTSHLLGGGIGIHRGAEVVEPTADFAEHLRTAWTPFVHSTIDALLKFGFVPVSFAESTDDATTADRRGAPMVLGKATKRARSAASDVSPRPIVPFVPPTGSYSIRIHASGAHGYARSYRIVDAHEVVDEDSYLYVRSAPDAQGNCCSPMAAVFDSGSFVAALSELALMSEASRSRPHLVTQLRRRETGANPLLDAQNLFFDAEARQIQTEATQAGDSEAMMRLATQRVLCQAINASQTRQSSMGASDA